MKRGEVWWAHVDKRRPVVLVSREEALIPPDYVFSRSDGEQA